MFPAQAFFHQLPHPPDDSAFAGARKPVNDVQQRFFRSLVDVASLLFQPFNFQSSNKMLQKLLLLLVRFLRTIHNGCQYPVEVCICIPGRIERSSCIALLVEWSIVEGTIAGHRSYALLYHSGGGFSAFTKLRSSAETAPWPQAQLLSLSKTKTGVIS